MKYKSSEPPRPAGINIRSNTNSARVPESLIGGHITLSGQTNKVCDKCCTSLNVQGIISCHTEEYSRAVRFLLRIAPSAQNLPFAEAWNSWIRCRGRKTQWGKSEAWLCNDHVSTSRVAVPCRFVPRCRAYTLSYSTMTYMSLMLGSLLASATVLEFCSVSASLSELPSLACLSSIWRPSTTIAGCTHGLHGPPILGSRRPGAYLRRKERRTVGNGGLGGQSRPSDPQHPREKWTSTDVARIGFVGESVAPILVLIGVKPDILSGEDGRIVAEECNLLLVASGIPDVEVEVREAVALQRRDIWILQRIREAIDDISSVEEGNRERRVSQLEYMSSKGAQPSLRVRVPRAGSKHNPDRVPN